ncbi:hypothetical protein NW754_007403 [Fusarium falciforme]|nr:hypothetical protein NW754_007403 [Fusarium falciforme]
MALVEFSANIVSGCAFGWAAEKILTRIRILSLRSLLSQTITWHNTDGRTPGTLISYIISDASALSNISGSTIGLLLAAAVNLVAGSVVSFILAWKIAIVLAPCIPVLLASGLMKLRTQAKFAERHQKAFAQATSITVEAVDNIRIVSAFSLERQSNARSADDELNPQSSGKNHRDYKLLLSEKSHDMEAADSRPDGTVPSVPVSSGQGMNIQLQDVHFEYPSRPGQPVLCGVNLNIQAGQFCALAGSSGSGKSTIFAMLERFYRPNRGAVLMDGTDITRQLGTEFRDDIALVPQENVLFEGSIAFNLGLGARPGHQPSQEEMEEACRAASIHDVIMALPEGYQTKCSHDGKQFSGGQRQRLSIARALLRRPRLLLLDESTSALDGESERRIQDALMALRGRTTIVAIAHRLNTIQRADRIYLIEGGQCVEQGTHNELIARSETYRTSVIQQSIQS